MDSFISNVEAIRNRAKENMENGAVTRGYRADRKTVVRLLNEALATEIVCVLRYRQHAETAKGIHSEAVIKEFQEHAMEEQEHANWLAKRIGQLNGVPDMNPATLTDRSHSEYKECETLSEMLSENLAAERIAIESYTEMIGYIGEKDPSTRRLLERILEKEEEHADDLAKLRENTRTDVPALGMVSANLQG